EVGESAFKLSVKRHGPGDGAHGARTGPVVHRRLRRGLLQLGVRRQAEVVVRREVDDVAAVEPGPGGLLPFEDPRVEGRPGSLQLLELLPQVIEAALPALRHVAITPSSVRGSPSRTGRRT